MKRLLVAAVIALVGVVPASAFNWMPNAAEVAKSVVAISHMVPVDVEGRLAYRNVCTGFSIDQRRQLVMTAAHCLDDNMRTDGFGAWPVFIDAEADLAVVQSVGINKPALRPGKDAKVGQDLAAVGYGFGLEKPLFTTVRVAAVDMPLEGLIGKWLMVKPGYIGGMSGGPVIDENGNVVSIVQRANAYVGVGRSIRDILALTQTFWQFRR